MCIGTPLEVESTTGDCGKRADRIGRAENIIVVS
jgi:hypothetical protein